MAMRARRLVTLAALYFLGARLGLYMEIPGTSATPVWPPAGIAVLALSAWGLGYWPGVWLGAWMANYSWTGASWASAWTAVIIACGNTTEGVVVTHGLRRYSTRAGRLCAVVIGCAIAATVGPIAVHRLHAFQDPPWVAAVAWFVGDVGGIVAARLLRFFWRIRDVTVHT